MKVVVLYAHYEKNDQYKENLRHFLEHGLIADVDTVVISNGPITIKIPERVKLLTRENTGADFGAWNHGLRFLKGLEKGTEKGIEKGLEKGLEKEVKYDYYFFINRSVRGPFLPKYHKGNWLDAFLELFNPNVLDVNVHLVGTTICVMHSKHEFTSYVQKLAQTYGISKKPPYIHVQSMFFGMTQESLDYIWSRGLFSYSGKTLIDTVLNQEIILSTLILDKGWNINCLLDKFRDIDYRYIGTDCETLGINGDLWFQNTYFWKNIHPYEVIFFKNSRLPLIEYDVFRYDQVKFRFVAVLDVIGIATNIHSDSGISTHLENKSWQSIIKKYIPEFTYDVMKYDWTLPSIQVGTESRVCQLQHDFFYKFEINRLRMAIESAKPTVAFLSLEKNKSKTENSNNNSLLIQGEQSYKGFTELWTMLLDKLGLINWALAPIPYFVNCWILSKDRYSEYQDFLNRVYDTVAKNVELKNKLGLMTPHIYNRLPCLYFYMKKWDVYFV